MKKLVSILLVLVMCASVLPAFAADNPSKTTEDNVKTTEATIKVGDKDVVIGVNTDKEPDANAISVILVTEADEGDDSAQKTLTEMAQAGDNTADYFTGGINAEAEAEPISEEEEEKSAAANEDLTKELDNAAVKTENGKDEETNKDVIIETKTASVEFGTAEKTTTIAKTESTVKDAETGAVLSTKSEIKVVEENADNSSKTTTTTTTKSEGKTETVVEVVEKDVEGKEKTTTTTTTDTEKEEKTEVVVVDSEGNTKTTTSTVDKEAKDMTTTTTENGITKTIKVIAATKTNEGGTQEKVNPIVDTAKDSTKKLTVQEHFPLKANTQNLDPLDEDTVIPYPITFDAPTFNENDELFATVSFVTIDENGIETTTYYVVTCTMDSTTGTLNADLPVSILRMMGKNNAAMTVYTVDDVAN